MKKKRKKKIKRVVKGFVGMMLIGGILKVVMVMFLWNALIPALFGGPMIGFFQALGLMFLSRLLFGKRRRGWSGRQRRKWSSEFGEWKQEMKQKMAEMTPEERERFRRGFKKGPWDVNIIEIEEEEEVAEETDAADDQESKA